ncbi:MAG TPA: hypothetical protein VJR05_04955 [Acidimicrobiia bacterium]|nr:hypothetical protein [Acidimicrobiia bacterium]
MTKRLLVLALFASVLVVAPTQQALACSCRPLDLATEVPEYDAAFVGTLVERPNMSLLGDAPYHFEVEQWVKGDLGPELDVLAPSQGAACGFEAPLGERVGVLVQVENGIARGNLCTMANPDLLLVWDRALAVESEGPPVFLVAGSEGLARLVLLDEAAQIVALVGGEGENLNGLTVCPGSSLLVEMVNDQLVVRSTADLREVRRIDLMGLPFEVGVPNIWCRDPAAQQIWLGTDQYTEEGEIIFQVLSADNLDQPLLEGPYSWMEVGPHVAVGGEGPTAETIWRIDLASGERTLLHKIPVDSADSSPSGRGFINPNGTQVMVSEWRYNDDRGGLTNLFLYDLESGEVVSQIDSFPTADGVGWIDERRFLLYSYPDINSDQVDNVIIDVVTSEVTVLDEFAGWRNHILGEQMVGAMEARLRAVPLAGGQPIELRLLPSEYHYLAAILDPEAQLAAPTTTSGPITTSSPTTSTAVPRTSEGPGSWPLLLAAMGVVGLIVIARR